MANKLFDNFFLQNEATDQFNSHLNLEQFAKHDTDLDGVAGMIKKIRRYKASNGTEKLAMGEGNTKSIETSFDELDYTIKLAQNRFQFYDEEMMKDPYGVAVGVRHRATDMYNTVNADIYAEFLKASNTVTATNPDFAAFVDAVALLQVKAVDSDPAKIEVFGLVSPKDIAKVRKALKDDLKYVESFARTGYVGTVAGVNLYSKQDATEGKIAIGTREAVTIFTKGSVGTETSTNGNRSADDANIRLNTMFLRKYYVVALTDDTKAAVINIGA